MNSPIIITFIEQYYQLRTNFAFLPFSIEHFKNNIFWCENIQHIILNYKYLNENKINFIIKNNNLIKYSPDSIILNENIDILKTIQLKCRIKNSTIGTNTLLKWYNNYKTSDEVNIGFLDNTIFEKQKIPIELSNKIVKTHIENELIDILNNNFNIDKIKYYNDFINKNLLYIDKNIITKWKK